MNNQTILEPCQDYWIGRFNAMACPCEVLVSTSDKEIAQQALNMASEEAWRIESRFSRYRTDNIVHQINHARGKAVKVDDETAHMLDFADHCYQLSNHKFDITAGILNRIWKFDGSNRIPEQSQVDELLDNVGWDKVVWNKPIITLAEGMEIDFGGIGKEYAVDQSVLRIQQTIKQPVLINYGGDIFATAPRKPETPWLIGVDNTKQTKESSSTRIELFQGGLATSGDTRRYLLKDGKRYSHILDPETGWPVQGAPHTISVVANSCLEAGMLATFAMLKGTNAEDFLQQQNVYYWIS